MIYEYIYETKIANNDNIHVRYTNFLHLHYSGTDFTYGYVTCM